MTLHAALAAEIASRFGAHLDGAPRLEQDALTLRFQNGLVLQARFASPEEYSIQWRFGEAEQRIDTAPLHPELASFPQHRHGADGAVRADELTQPGRAPLENLSIVIGAILHDPLLRSGQD
jgi:hypothetical protein